MKLERYNLIGASGGLSKLREVLPSILQCKSEHRHVADCATPEDAAYLAAQAKEIADMTACLDDIDILARGYDGYEKPESLKGLIDDLAALARTRKPMPIEKESGR